MREWLRRHVEVDFGWTAWGLALVAGQGGVMVMVGCILITVEW